MTDPEQTAEAEAERAGRGGVQSLEAALQVLLLLAEEPGPMALSDLARAAGMPAPKVHRYLSSFLHLGLVVQRQRAGRYDLGPAARALGLAALARADLVTQAGDQLEDLVAETGLTALLAVWGPSGATVVRWARAPSPILTSLGLGSILPLLTSASGRVFLAFLPPALTAAIAEAEGTLLPGVTARDPDLADLEGLKAGIRAEGLARVEGRFIPGLAALSAPILDWQGEAVAAVTLIGTDPGRLAPGGSAAVALSLFARAAGAGR